MLSCIVRLRCQRFSGRAASRNVTSRSEWKELAYMPMVELAKKSEQRRDERRLQFSKNPHAPRVKRFRNTQQKVVAACVYNNRGSVSPVAVLGFPLLCLFTVLGLVACLLLELVTGSIFLTRRNDKERERVRSTLESHPHLTREAIVRDIHLGLGEVLTSVRRVCAIEGEVEDGTKRRLFRAGRHGRPDIVFNDPCYVLALRPRVGAVQTVPQTVPVDDIAAELLDPQGVP